MVKARIFILPLILMLLSSPYSMASEPIRGPIEARVIEVIDGDTISVAAHIWLDQEIITNIRILDIDTAEIHGHCDAEREMALRARNRLIELIDGKPVILTEISHGKFAGRVLSYVTLENGQSLSEILLLEELARPYDGGTREGWCS